LDNDDIKTNLNESLINETVLPTLNNSLVPEPSTDAIETITEAVTDVVIPQTADFIDLVDDIKPFSKLSEAEKTIMTYDQIQDSIEKERSRLRPHEYYNAPTRGNPG
jgi:hypothetical protein